MNKTSTFTALSYARISGCALDGNFGDMVIGQDMPRIPLSQVVEQLQAYFGKQQQSKVNGPWETILWENVAYLADGDRRREAFRILKKQVGTEPAAHS